MTETNRLRIAMQKSGRLSDDSQDLLERCGLKVRYHAQRLLAMAENMPVEILRVRDDDIPGLVMDGVVDLGIIGENVLEETVLARRSQGQSTDFRMLRRFDFGGCRLSIAIPADQEWAGLESLDGCRIATSYPQLLKRCFDERGLTFKPCLLTGSVEVAPRAGLADAICDLVSSGATLEANGLREVETVLRSEAALIACPSLDADKRSQTEQLVFRFRSIRESRDMKYVLMNLPKERLGDAIRILPGMPSKRLLPLPQEGWCWTQAILSQDQLWTRI